MTFVDFSLRPDQYPLIIEFVVHRTCEVFDTMTVNNSDDGVLDLPPYMELIGESIGVRFRFPDGQSVYRGPNGETECGTTS